MERPSQTQQEAAAAVVCAVYFVCLLGTASNIKTTGFKLYIPLTISALMRTAAFATRAAYHGTGSMLLIAASRALQAIGLGISMVMCSCFLVIWIRNAQPSHLSIRAAQAVTMLFKCLIGCVIIMGAVLGIVGAGMANAPHNEELRAHGVKIRQGSVTGFLIVSCMLTLVTAAVVANWMHGTTAAANMKQELQATHQGSSCQRQFTAAQCETDDLEIQLPVLSRGVPWQQHLRGDGLILVLLLCDVLLTWSASAAFASLFHPELLSNAQLYYPVAVLPEMVEAVVFAWPKLAARLALGERFSEWQEEQVLQRQQQQQQLQLPEQVLKDPLN